MPLQAVTFFAKMYDLPVMSYRIWKIPNKKRKSNREVDIFLNEHGKNFDS